MLVATCTIKCATLNWVWLILCSVIELGLMVALIALYAITIGNITNVDLEMMNYFKDNSCSDEVLQFAITQYVTSYKHDLAVTGLGLAFVIVTLIFHLGAVIFFTPVKKCCAIICCCKVCW